MKKLLAVVLAFAMVMSFGALAFAAGSPTAADVTAAKAPAVAAAPAAAAPAAAAPAKDYSKIQDANGNETDIPAADVLEDADTGIARLETEDAAVAEAVKAFFAENADNVGQGIINVSDEDLEKIATDEFGIPVKAKGVAEGETVKVIVIFPNGETMTFELTAVDDEVVIIPLSKEYAKNIAYVIVK